MADPYEIDILQHDIDHKNPHWLTPEGGYKPPPYDGAPGLPKDEPPGQKDHAALLDRYHQLRKDKFGES